jgi:hypothetical protein
MLSGWSSPTFQRNRLSLSSGPKTKARQASSFLGLHFNPEDGDSTSCEMLLNFTKTTWYSPVQSFVKHIKKIIPSWSHLSRHQKVNHDSRWPTFQDMRILQYDITDILSWWQIENYRYMPRSKTCEECFTFTVTKKSSSYLVHWHSDIMCVSALCWPCIFSSCFWGSVFSEYE